MKSKLQQTTTVAKKLAAMSDSEIARLVRGSHRLRPRRRPRRARAGTQALRWTAAEERVLGKWPDKRLAHFLGRTAKAVQGRRLKLGIRFALAGRAWTEDEDRLLDPASAQGPLKRWTRQLARQLGRSTIAVQTRRRLKYAAACKRRPW